MEFRKFKEAVNDALGASSIEELQAMLDAL